MHRLDLNKKSKIVQLRLAGIQGDSWPPLPGTNCRLFMQMQTALALLITTTINLVICCTHARDHYGVLPKHNTNAECTALKPQHSVSWTWVTSLSPGCEIGTVALTI